MKGMDDVHVTFYASSCYLPPTFQGLHKLHAYFEHKVGRKDALRVLTLT
jgi:hypothetical protein